MVWENEIKTRFYPFSFFKKIDEAFLASYQAVSCYAVSKDFLKRERAKDIYSYGETPLPLFYEIFSKWGPKKDQLFVDLGSGASRGLFLGAALFEGRFLGIEKIPFFVKKAQLLAQRFSLRNLQFILGDFKTVDLSAGDIFFYYSLLEEDDEIKKMCDKFVKSCKSSSLWITVSFPLEDFDERFRIKEAMRGKFAWGDTTLYLNCLKKDSCCG